MKEYNNSLPLSPLLVAPDIVPYGQGTSADTIKAIKGSGGDYLSNEIFYRVSYLRSQSSYPSKLTGHIHLGFLKSNSHPNKANLAQMLFIFTKSVQNAIQTF